VICVGFIGVLLMTGWLRLSAFEASWLTPFAQYATIVFIGAIVVFGIALQRAGVDFQGLGFGVRPKLWHVGAALLGVALLQLWSHFGYGAAADIFTAWGIVGESRVDERFGHITGDAGALVSLLIMSWTFAALGEELCYRIFLLGGLKSALGGGKGAALLALFLASFAFGAVHFYKGPVGMTSSAVSGLIFGVLVLLARGAIWPAFLAHGLNNSVGIWAMYQSAN